MSANYLESAQAVSEIYADELANVATNLKREAGVCASVVLPRQLVVVA